MAEAREIKSTPRDPMSRKILFTWNAAIILTVALGIVFLWHTIKLFVGEHGTVSSVSVLQKVYNKAGPEIAATFTNSLIQKFTFSGQVDWKLVFFKDPAVVLLGRVNTNALRQFISDNPSTQFIWDGIDKNGENCGEEGWPDAKEYSTTTWKGMFFRSPNIGAADVGKYSGFIDGTVEFPSCKVVIISR
jgi:hypothetical protein